MVLTTLLLFVSQLYFGWILPLKTSKDWIIAVCTFPLSAFVFFSPMFGTIAAAAIVPDNRTSTAYVVFTIISVLNLIGSWIIAGVPSEFGAKLNLFQSIVVAAWLIYTVFTMKKGEGSALRLNN